MLDVDEGLGSAVCRELQREHALDRVMFHHTDVTDRSMLVHTHIDAGQLCMHVCIVL